MTIELDAAGVSAAMDVLRENVLVGSDPFTPAYWTEIAQEIITAYLAARPTPDAAVRDQSLWTVIASKLREISEDHYCAGWMSDLEYDIWDMVQGGNRNYGLYEVSEEDIAALRRLSELCGGWVAYLDEVGSEQYVAMETWQAMVRAHKAATR